MKNHFRGEVNEVVAMLSDALVDAEKTGAGEWKRGEVRIVGGYSCEEINSSSWLRCPTCGDEYLHQGAIHCWDRFIDEIGAKGTHLTVGTHHVSFDTDQSENPSSRRHGVAIDFHCEQCNDAYEMQLVLSQHKGNTEIYWRYRVNPDSEMWGDDSQARSGNTCK